MTQTVSVRCQQCGAPLQINDSVRFVTCGFCHAELEVVRSEATIHTQLLAQIATNTRSLDDRVRTMEIESKIDRLDRQWGEWKSQYLRRDRAGVMIEPGRPRSAKTLYTISGFAGVTVVALSLYPKFGTTSAFRISTESAFAQDLFWVAAVAAFTYAVLKRRNDNAETYQASLRYYEAQRAELMQELQSPKAPA